VIAIREARIEDAPALFATEVAVSAIPGLLVSAPDELSPDSFKRMIEQLSDDVGCVLVAEDEGRISGYALLRPMDLRAIAHVFRLTVVVNPASWKRGIGKALMQGLANWAAQSSRVKKVELLVRSTNAAARALYARCGFVEEGRLRNRVRLPSGDYVDDISMAWFPKREHT